MNILTPTVYSASTHQLGLEPMRRQTHWLGGRGLGLQGLPLQGAVSEQGGHRAGEELWGSVSGLCFEVGRPTIVWPRAGVRMGVPRGVTNHLECRAHEG